MPKYTINGVTYSSATPLSEADLEELAGGVSAAPKQAVPEKRSMLDEFGRQVGLTARAGYEAFTAPATAVLEAGRTAYNLGAKALGSESRLPSFYEEQRKALTNVAKLPEAETKLERAVQAGTQAMASTGLTAAALPGVSAFSADLARQVPASAAAGLAAQPTAEAVKEYTGSDTAALIASVGLGAAAAGAAGKAINAVTQGKQPLMTMQEVKQRASRSYTAMDESGVSIKPTSAQGMINDVRTALDDARLIPGTDAANEINATLAQMNKVIGSKDVSFTALENLRSMLNDLKGSSDKNVQRLGNVAVSEFDKYVTNLTAKDISAGAGQLDKAVKDVMSARKDWRNASRAEILDDALNVAEAKALDPKASESELIRRGFINIAADKNKMKLFSGDEQNVIKSVANGGNLDKVLSFVARFNPLRSQLAMGGTIGVSYYGNPAAGLTLGGAGLAADAIQSGLRSKAAETAVKQIASGAVPEAVQSTALRGVLAAPAVDVNGSERQKQQTKRQQEKLSIAQQIRAEAEAQGMGQFADLLVKQAHQESRFNPRAVSNKGAQGVFQLMPATAKDLGVQDVFNPQENIKGGVAYMKQLLVKYNGDITKALAAYNWGMGRVDRLGLERMPSETRKYLKNILE